MSGPACSSQFTASKPGGVLLCSGKEPPWPIGLLQKTGVLALKAIDLFMNGLALKGCVVMPPVKLWQPWC